MLKGLSLKSFVASVVFSFSLVVACISPAWALISSDNPDSFSVYAGYPTVDPVYKSSPCLVPFSGNHLFTSMNPASTVSNVFVHISVPEIIPASYDRTLVLDLGFSGKPIISMDNYLGYQDVTFFRGSTQSVVLANGCSAQFRNGVTDTYGNTVFHNITIPAGCTGFETKSACTWSISGDGSPVGLVSYGGYVVATADHNLVDLVSNILSRVNSIDGNVSSSLSALNQILVQCQGIKADTSTISSILQLVSNNIVALNGKVDDIYKLLKDSLATESQALDQKSENVAGQIMQRVDAEQFWSDKNTENFTALDMGNWSFGDGVVGALPTVGNLFKSLWDSIGDATLIFVFPLMLGIALVIVGRLSRTAGKGSKKGGGDDG